MRNQHPCALRRRNQEIVPRRSSFQSNTINRSGADQIEPESAIDALRQLAIAAPCPPTKGAFAAWESSGIRSDEREFESGSWDDPLLLGVRLTL